MTKLFTTLIEGTPSEIRNEIFGSLNVITEERLKEQRKITIAELFSKEVSIEKPQARKPWTFKQIREGLEKAALNELQVNTLVGK
jgi:hypothetical protein